jgi:hypothetical protein
VVLEVFGDILRAVDRGDLEALALLDLSTAFDTLAHANLLQRIWMSCGLGSKVVGWFEAYLSDRTQFVRCGGAGSMPTLGLCAVPQDSVLGPIRFFLYTSELLGLVNDRGLNTHIYADHTQDVTAWMLSTSNRLQLNLDKIEVI